MSGKDDDDDFDGPIMKMSQAARRKLVSRARAILKATACKKTLWDVIDEYTLDALVELRLALMTGSPRLRFAASDRLTAVWTRMPPRPAAPPAKGMSAEEYEAALVAAEQDPAVRKWLVEKRGWTAPKEKGTSN